MHSANAKYCSDECRREAKKAISKAFRLNNIKEIREYDRFRYARRYKTPEEKERLRIKSMRYNERLRRNRGSRSGQGEVA